VFFETEAQYVSKEARHTSRKITKNFIRENEKAHIKAQEIGTVPKKQINLDSGIVV
jgi:hypothetical protein